MLQNSRRILIAIASIVLLACCVFLISFIVFLRSSVVSDEQGLKYVVPQGASLKAVVHDLSSQNIITHPKYFDLLIFLKGSKHELKAGEYLFPKGTSPLSLLGQITSGTGMLYHKFTIVAGWSFKHLRDVLNQDPDLMHHTSLMSDAVIMTHLGHAEMNPEGRFYPDSYYFAKGSSDLALLKRAFLKMENKFNDAWKQRDTDLPYQMQNDVLTVASLVEKETKLNAERSIIAGVIVNRLKKNMLLQIDPTVIYAAGASYSGKIYKSDLQSNSPYNTYKHKGLPPTPIAIPSMESLLAALHPQHHDYYYFVAKNSNPSNGHQFSTTLTEHNAAVSVGKNNRASIHFAEQAIQKHLLRFK